MTNKSVCRRLQRSPALVCVLLAGLLASASNVHPSVAANSHKGKDLLETNCARCHAVQAGDASPKKEAPNLWVVLSAYPVERLEHELAEGIGSRHPDMPQVQFSDEQIADIFEYLHRRPIDTEYRQPD